MRVFFRLIPAGIELLAVKFLPKSCVPNQLGRPGPEHVFWLLLISVWLYMEEHGSVF
jgi:hypothetical protein